MIQVIVSDAQNELHQIEKHERVLLVARSWREAAQWLSMQGITPYGTQFTFASSGRALEGGRWPVVIWLPGWEGHLEANQILNVVQRMIAKMPLGVREIHA